MNFICRQLYLVHFGGIEDIERVFVRVHEERKRGVIHKKDTNTMIFMEKYKRF